MNSSSRSALSALDMRLISAVVAGGLAWVVLLWALVGPAPVAALLLLLASMTGLGYLLLAAGGFLRGKTQLRLVFAPAGGFIVLAACFALAARLGAPQKLVFWVLGGAGALACLLPARAFFRGAGQQVPGGVLLVLISVLLALVFYRPGLELNAVLQPDGRYAWIDGDASREMARAASIKIESPPGMPGMPEAPLVYHFGAQAIAAYLSLGTGLDLPAAMKVLHGLGLLALFLAAAGCSRTFATILGDRRLAAPFGILGLFFVVAYTDVIGRIPVRSALMDRITASLPQIFTAPAQFYFGHSVLWGLIGLIFVFGLLAAEWRLPAGITRPVWVLGLVAALLVPLSFWAGGGACGILAGTAVIVGLRKPAAWLFAAATVGATVLTFAAMGVFAYSTSVYVFDPSFPSTGFHLTVWLFLGLGLTMYAFRYLSITDAGPPAVALALACVGYMASFVLVNSTDYWQNDAWGMSLLQYILTLLAFVALSYPLGRLVDGDMRALHDESIALFGTARTLCVVWAGILLAFAGLVLILRLPFRPVYAVSIGATAAAIPIATACISLYRRHREFRYVAHGAMGLLLVMGIAGSPPLYGPLASARPVYLSAGEYTGLEALRSISQRQDIIATNRHDLPGSSQPGASYTYFPVLERRIVLEGFDSREDYAPQFPTVERDNALLFSTTDAGRAREIVDAYAIDFIVCRPGTTLQLPNPLPAWLERLDNTGSLAIYRVLR